MISHVCLGVGDFDRAFAFYSKIMADLDLTLKFCEASKPWAGWVSKTSSRPLFVIGKPFDGNACEPGNGNMVALLAPNREAVRRSHATALALGGTCEGAPGLRPHYHPDYYGAYFRDLTVTSFVSAATARHKIGRRSSSELPTLKQSRGHQPNSSWTLRSRKTLKRPMGFLTALT